MRRKIQAERNLSSGERAAAQAARVHESCPRRTQARRLVRACATHSTSALKAAAIVRRSTEMNGDVYWISALLRTCAAHAMGQRLVYYYT